MRYLIIAFTLMALAAPAAAQSSQPAAAPSALEQSQDATEFARLNAQVSSLSREGKYDEALPVAERVLALAETSFGGDDVRVADALSNLAELRVAKKEYESAETLSRRALVIYEKMIGADSPQVMRTLRRLTVISFRRGNYDTAEELSRRVVALAEAKYGADHIETARAWVNVAETHRLRGEVKKAEEDYARVLGAAEKTKPAAIPHDVTQALANYLGVLYARGLDDDPTIERINKLLVAVGAEAPPSSRETIKGGVLNGHLVYNPSPAYPPEARQARAQGTVIVRVLVDEMGKVINAEAMGDNFNSALRRAAERAAWRARFTPTLLSGVPVKVTGTITYNFVLQIRSRF
jgi:TonB family protein